MITAAAHVVPTSARSASEGPGRRVWRRLDWRVLLDQVDTCGHHVAGVIWPPSGRADVLVQAKDVLWIVAAFEFLETLVALLAVGLAHTLLSLLH